MSEKQTFRFGPFQLDAQCGQLRKDGVGLKLQGQPVLILELLLEKPGQLVTREELRQRLWPSDTFVDFDHSLNTAIKKLRQALGDEAEAPRYIETLPKRGYRFVGEVVGENAARSNSGAAPVSSYEIVRKFATTLIDAALSEHNENRRRVRRRVWLPALSFVLLLAASVSAHWMLRPLPLPRIVRLHVLTDSPYPKTNDLASDGRLIYFTETRPSGSVVLQVPIGGGAVSEVSNAFGTPRDISGDGSKMLTLLPTQEGTFDAWSVPLPAGTPHLITNNVGWAVWTADGRGIFFSRNKDTELYRVDNDGSELRLLAEVPDVNFLHRSPDGSQLRFSVTPGFELWQVNADGSHLLPILPERIRIYGGTWSPDGKYYFFTSWDGDTQSLWGMSAGRSRWRRNGVEPQALTFGPISVGPPVVSRDGRQLYAVGTERRGQLSVYDDRSRQFVPYLSAISACYVDFSRDRQWMAYVSYPEGTLWRSRVDGSDKKQLTLPPLAVMNPRWSPDGKLIAFTDYSNGDRRQMTSDTPRRIYAMSSDGGTPMLLVAGAGVGDPAWSPDGNSIAYARVKWSIASDRVKWLIMTNRAASVAEAEVRMLDLKTQKSTQVPGSDGLWSPRWSRDGKYLVAMLKFPVEKLMLFDFARKSWEELAAGTNFSWPSWSHDSRFVQAQDGDSLVRIAISDHKKELITSLKEFRSTAYFLDQYGNGWFGLTPDDRPVTTRDTRISEIYAFDLEYK